MGNLSLIATIGALVVVASLMFSSRTRTQEVDLLLGEQTYKNLAREAAITGLNMTMRRMVADTLSWATNPSQYEFTDRTYQNARFSTRISTGYSPSLKLHRCIVDTVDIVSTAVSDGGRTHELRGTVVRTCSDEGGLPPFFRYVVISERDLTLASSPEIRSITTSANADIHTNQSLESTSAAIVEGFGSYVDTYKCVGSSCDGFSPNVDPLGYGEENLVNGSYIQLPPLYVEDYRYLATHTSASTVEFLNEVIDFTHFTPPEGGPAITGFGTEENPFVWYVQGDFDVLKKGSVRTVGHGVIITEGSVHVNAGANLISSVPADVMVPEIDHGATDAEIEAQRDWFEAEMTEGITLALYANDEIHLNGQNSIVMAQMYSNGDNHINGHQTVYGAMACRAGLKFNGAGVNIWFAGANTSMAIPGIEIIMPDGIRLIAYSEW